MRKKKDVKPFKGYITKIGEAKIDDPKSLQDFRDTFLTPHGRRVFTHLLYECGFFRDDIKTESEVALRNHATRLLKIIGGQQPVGAYYITDSLLNSLSSISLYPVEEKDNKTETPIYGEVLKD